MTKLQQLLDEYKNIIFCSDESSCMLGFSNSNDRCDFTRKLNWIGDQQYQYHPNNTIEVFFKDDRYPEKPHEFKLTKLHELPAVLIGPDGKCDCSVNDRCINPHKTHKNRCTLKELEQLSREAIARRAWQSGDW